MSWGVVSKVVKTKLPESFWSIRHGDESGELPVMLETTATVYAGASGGLVANSEGHMIGLITRYYLLPVKFYLVLCLDELETQFFQL